MIEGLFLRVTPAQPWRLAVRQCRDAQQLALEFADGARTGHQRRKRQGGVGSQIGGGEVKHPLVTNAGLFLRLQWSALFWQAEGPDRRTLVGLAERGVLKQQALTTHPVCQSTSSNARVACLPSRPPLLLGAAARRW